MRCVRPLTGHPHVQARSERDQRSEPRGLTHPFPSFPLRPGASVRGGQAVPRTAQARAVRGMLPSGPAGRRPRSSSRSAPRRDSSRETA
jgi:hypothetical protein